MIVRFENILSRESFTRSMQTGQLSKMKARALWCVDGEIYWINKVIHFDSHANAIVSPLYAWECLITDTDWDIFDIIAEDEVYSKKLTDKLCLRYHQSELGVADKSGNAIHLKEFEFSAVPPVKIGDAFVIEDVVYLVKSFEVHRRLYGRRDLERIVVVTDEIEEMFAGQTAIANGQKNPLKFFLGEF